MSREDYITVLLVLLNLPNSEDKDLDKLQTTTLKLMYEGLKANALAYNELSVAVETYKNRLSSY